MKIILGSDHGGYQLKEHLKNYLKNKELEDLGVFSEESSHYPEIAKKVAKKVVAEKCFGILICGTGIGVSIAANKVHGARAALCHNIEYAALARQHNHANILCLGGRFMAEKLAEEIVDGFLSTAEEGGRHDFRVEMFDKMTC
jgi:ribose 5-phosphate isomerase B